MCIIGIQPTSFTPPGAAEPIVGTSIYLTEPLDPRRGGVGQKSEKIFLSQLKASRLDFIPKVGMEITVSFNRWGKPESLFLVSDPSDSEVD